MPFFPKSKDEMIADGLEAIRNNTNITQLSPGSKTRFLLDAMTEEQASQHELFDSNMAQAFIRWADARYLDYFGDMLNIPRLEARRGSVQLEDQNFIFYVDGGTFGDINSGNSITIPAGTIISTPDAQIERRTFDAEQNEESTEIVQYELVSTVSCPSDRSFAYGTLRAKIEGSVSDVPRNVLKKHTFTGYALSGSNRLKCTNKYAIANGRNRETDGSYRYRLMNAFKARERANKLAIRLAALSVAGVSDVIDVNCEQGPGTFSLYVEATTPTTSPRILSNVEDVVETVCAYGVRPFVLAPLSLGLELVVAVNWKSETTEEEKAIGYAAIRDAVEAFISNQTIGESLTLQDLATVAASSDVNIQGIGLQKSGEFEEVYVYRGSLDGDNVRKVLFTGPVVEPLYNEKIILETNTNDRGVIFI